MDRREEFWGATIARITRFFSYLALTVLHYSPYNCLSDIITSTYFVTSSCAIASVWLRPGLRFIFPGAYATPTYPSYTSEPGRCWNAYLLRNWYRWRASEIPTLKVYYDEHMCPAVIMWGRGGEGGGLANLSRREIISTCAVNYAHVFPPTLNIYEYLCEC